MPVSDPSATVVLDISRAEQWVLHHVLLDTLGVADGRAREGGRERDRPSGPSIAVIEKLEDGTFAFTGPELRLIQRTCRAHAETTSLAADRNLASAVADRIGAALDEDGARA